MSSVSETLLRPGMLIGSEWVYESSAGTIEHVNPATGKMQQLLPVSGPAEVDAAVAAARAALPGWRACASAERASFLHRIAELLRARSADCSTVTTLENGTPVAVSAYMGAGAAMWFDYYAGWVDKVVGDVYPTGGTGLDYTLLEPFGVVGVMPTWNGPLGMIGFKVAPALAAGCTVVLKSPELAPFSSNLFAEVCLEVGLPPGVLNVVTGGPETGDALVRHPGIDKVSFTGGTATGRKIQAACAETLTPLVLELGGKSASIVFEDADVSRVIASAVQGIALLSGQVCIAPTRLLVHDALYGTITEHLAGALPSVKVGDPLQPDTVMGPVVSAAACERILDVIEGAQHDKAGTLLSGGRRLDGELSGGFFVEPTAFVDVDPASPLARDEIFGPVLAVSRFSTEDEAVELANDSSYGLAAYLHTTNFARAHRVAAALDAGNIAINGGLPMAGPVAPFGGFKDSGHGKEGGLAGIMEYLRIKNVNVDLS